MSTPSPMSRAAISRSNGALSTGPVTAEGKARSAMNALRHGMTSETVVLPHESREEFERHLAAYLHDFNPLTHAERELVETMAAARWRLNRLIAIETEHLANALAACPDANLAEAFSNSANHDRTLSLLIRYEGQINRTYERAFKQLTELKKRRPPQSPAAKPMPSRDLREQRNEPRPAPVMPPPTPDNAARRPDFESYPRAIGVHSCEFVAS